jgi:hypothetical protein
MRKLSGNWLIPQEEKLKERKQDEDSAPRLPDFSLQTTLPPLVVLA